VLRIDARSARAEEAPDMLDVVLIVTTVVFFASAVLYVHACERS
jgi:hypothetical protein